MHSLIRPNTHVALRLPSGILKIVEIVPNTVINLGRFGSFSSNQLIGRPYRFTYELLEKEDAKAKAQLRVVTAAELHAEALGNDQTNPPETGDEDNAPADNGFQYDIVGDDGEVLMRNNRLTIDDPSRQTLSMDEIEELKKAAVGSGKDIIAKIMASHLGIEEKTSFSLAKYTLRKSKKYLKRFTAIPLDIGLLMEYVSEREAYKIMELRDETLGLVCSWANVHHASTSRYVTGEDGVSQVGGGRWLVVDDTSGLITAALAEKMGILYPSEETKYDDSEEEDDAPSPSNNSQNATKSANGNGVGAELTASKDTTMPDAPAPQSDTPSQPIQQPRRTPFQHVPQSDAQTNTLTVLHPNNQPNLSLLKYFGFDAGNPLPNHPLYAHLKSVSWLQLLEPTSDPTYIEPEFLSDEVLSTLKSSKRGAYYRKRRRWERTKRIVDETRSGGFDGLVVASSMDPEGIMKKCVPLVKGGGQVVVYNPTTEPLVRLCDYYSKDRKAAYIAREFGAQQQSNGQGKNGGVGTRGELGDNGTEVEDDANGTENGGDDEDFPLNPTLLLAPSLQTARAKQWQVLPGRTHPLMTSKGGAEGYLFTATRVLPIEGKVEARGHGRGKKRKTGPDTSVQA